ncbi:hypothetical protein BDZ97DRAFT_1824560 [Flammula alnicola]|nr:hypothetical protein BDZ97DRAFT_1824560 [Flammula alnicola]
MATPVQQQAVRAVKNLRVQAFKGLMSHLRNFGPLPESPAMATAPDGERPVLLPNPFVAKKNPKTGKWRPPVYSLRRQAELVKKANATGTLHLLPPGPKTLAFDLRMQRVKASLPPTIAATLEESMQKKIESLESQMAQVKLSVEVETEALEAELTAMRAEVQKLAEEIEEFEISSGSIPKGSPEYKTHKWRRRSKWRLEHQIPEKEAELAALTAKVAKLPTLAEREQAAKQWMMPVEWVGKVAEKKTGAELGTRLYAGKKRMFKGHLWERQRGKRVARQSILMRDMAARVARYKEVRFPYFPPSPPISQLTFAVLHSITRRDGRTHSNHQDTRNLPSFPSNPTLFDNAFPFTPISQTHPTYKKFTVCCLLTPHYSYHPSVGSIRPDQDIEAWYHFAAFSGSLEMRSFRKHTACRRQHTAKHWLSKIFG